MAIPTSFDYSFTILCKSGQTKLFTCTAPNFNEARQLLAAFAQAN